MLQLQSNVQSQVHALEQQAREHVHAVEVQALTHVQSVESQAQQMVSAVQSEASATVRENQANAQVAIDRANSRVSQLESQASEVIHQMQLKHQAEILELQDTAQEAHLQSQQQINQLMTQLSIQSRQLDEQRVEQRELHKTIKVLQEEVTNLRRSNEMMQQQSQNGTGVDIAELMATIHDLRKDVKEAVSPKKGESRLHFPIAPPPIPMYSQGEAYEATEYACSACAGFDPRMSPSPHASKFREPRSQGSNQGYKPPGSGSGSGNIPWFSVSTTTPTVKPTGPPSSGGSSSDTEDGGWPNGPPGGGPGGGSSGPSVPGSPHGLGQSIGVGSNALGFITEKDVYRSKDLSLIKIDYIPTSAADFRAWKNTIDSSRCH